MYTFVHNESRCRRCIASRRFQQQQEHTHSCIETLIVPFREKRIDTNQVLEKSAERDANQCSGLLNEIQKLSSTIFFWYFVNTCSCLIILFIMIISVKHLYIRSITFEIEHFF